MPTFLKILRGSTLAAALLTGGAANADVIFTTMPTGTFHPAFRFDVSSAPSDPQEVAIRFTVTQTRLLTSVVLPMEANFATVVSGRIALGTGPTPGATVTDLIIPPVAAVNAYVATPAAATILRPGTYYLHLTGASPAVARWRLNDLFISNLYAVLTSSGWLQFNDTNVPATQINGDTVGACCNTFTGACAVIDISACEGLNLTVSGIACSPASCRACPGDFNRAGGVSVQDIFDFLQAYFAGCA